MSEGKSLAVAYAVKRRAGKKMGNSSNLAPASEEPAKGMMQSLLEARRKAQGGEAELHEEALPESVNEEFLADDMGEVSFEGETYPTDGQEHEIDESPRKKVLSGLMARHRSIL